MNRGDFTAADDESLSRFQLRLRGLRPFPHQKRACMISVAVTSGRRGTVHESSCHKSTQFTDGLARARLAQPISRLVNSGGDLAGNIETALRQLRVL